MRTGQSPRKVVRSYRLVFRRRWRIHRVQNWRIPLPQGIELRAIGYWAACLALIGLLGRLPLIGQAFSAIPASVRLLAVPIASAWALARWELDGRSPHRALLGLAAYLLRPRQLAALRRCPAAGSTLISLERVTSAPDLTAAEYPPAALRGPAQLLLRYPSEVEPIRPLRSAKSPSERISGARAWRVRKAAEVPLHKGHLLRVPPGGEVIFD